MIIVQKPVGEALKAKMEDANDANVVARDVADVGSRLSDKIFSHR